jgi:hypothetical protein
VLQENDGNVLDENGEVVPLCVTKAYAGSIIMATVILTSVLDVDVFTGLFTSGDDDVKLIRRQTCKT